MDRNRVQIILEMLDETKSGVSSIMGKIKDIAAGVSLASAEFAAVKYAAETAFSAIEKAIKPGYDAVENFTMSVTKMAAQITSYQGNSNIAENYRQAKAYGEQLVPVLERIDAKTIASAQDLGLITEEMMKQRVVLDTANKSQLDGFTNLANAAAVVAQGYPAKEIQLRQEIRSLLEGQVRTTDQLSQQINSMVGGNLKEQVALHKKDGDLIQWLGGLLKGYGAASEDIQNTWAAIGTSIETARNKLLREGFKEGYQEINTYLREGVAWLREHSAQISLGIRQGWLSVKGVVETVVNLFRGVSGPLGIIRDLTLAIMDGWGRIFYVILPPLSDLLGTIIGQAWDFARVMGNVGRIIWSALALDSNGIKAAWNDLLDASVDHQQKTAKLLKMDIPAEWVKRNAEWDRQKQDKSATVTTPALPPAPDAAAEAAAKKLAEEWKKVAGDLRLDMTKSAIEDPAEQRVAELNARAAELKKKFGANPLIDQWLSAMTDRVWDDSIKKLDDEIEKSDQKVLDGRLQLEEAEKRVAEAAKASREAQLSYELSLIDSQEKFQQIDKTTATERRISLTRELLRVQEDFLSSIDRANDPTGWYTQQRAIQETRDKLLDLSLVMEERTGTFGAGMSRGIKTFLQDARTMFQLGENVAKDTAQNMNQSFSTYFFDLMQGKFNTLGDTIVKFLQSVQKSIADLLAQMATDSIFRGIGNIVTSYFGASNSGDPPVTTYQAHDGGKILPRFHFGGLASDEVPAVLLTRERVLSREQNELFEKFVNKTDGPGNLAVTVNLENKSGSDLQAKSGGLRFDGARYVIDVVLDNINGYGELYHAVKGSK